MYAVCGGALLVSAAAQWSVLTWKKAGAARRREYELEARS